MRELLQLLNAPPSVVIGILTPRFRIHYYLRRGSLGSVRGASRLGEWEYSMRQWDSVGFAWNRMCTVGCFWRDDMVDAIGLCLIGRASRVGVNGG